MQAHCVPPCAENKIGLIFYRYMITNILTLNGVDILMTLGQRLLGMAVPYDPAMVRPSLPRNTTAADQQEHNSVAQCSIDWSGCSVLSGMWEEAMGVWIWSSCTSGESQHQLQEYTCTSKPLGFI